MGAQDPEGRWPPNPSEGAHAARLNLPANVLATGVLNLGTSQLTVNTTVTIPFEIFGVPFPIVIPLDPIVVQL